MPRASVIVPARDAAATLGATLAALARQDVGEPFEVIVVDDGSRDDTRAIATASGAVTQVIDQPGAGPGAARNRGAAAATGEVLAFTDADCEPQPGWLRAGLAAIAAGADLVQGRVGPPPGIPVGPFDRTVYVPGLSHLYETANLFVRRALFEDLGGFEGWLMPDRSKELGEDVWLGWRARRAGARVEFCDAAAVHHAVFPRDAAGYVAERARLVHFPEIARRIPEVRDAVFYRRVFLNRRTALFDLAVAGAIGAIVLRRPALLAAVAPYARLAARDRPRVAGVRLAADAVGAVALVRGSLAARTLVL